MAKKNEAKKELAYMLYMAGTTLSEIRERCGIGSPATLNHWIKDGNWKDKRAAKTITRTELVNGLIGKLSDMLDQDVNEFNADRLIKIAGTIEKLDKQDNVIVAMDVFTSFSCWLTNQAAIDKDLSLDTIKLFNKYQDAYISNKLAGNDG